MSLRSAQTRGATTGTKRQRSTTTLQSSLDYAPSYDASTEGFQLPFASDLALQVPDWNLCSPSFSELFTFDEPFESNNYALGPVESATDSYRAQVEKMCLDTDWCSWARHCISLDVVTGTSRVKAKPTLDLVNHSSCERYHAQRSADLIIQSWRAFPIMMLRRETFPWFIHPRSQLPPYSSAEAIALPPAISKCMGIAQMFVSRTPDTKQFLWQIIEAEYKHLSDTVCAYFPSNMISGSLTSTKVPQMSKYESLSASQACLMYLIMCVIDYAPENEGNGQDLLRTLWVG